jgi:hypothetical protein
MEIANFQPMVLELLQSINERLGILIDQNVAQASLAKGKSAFQTADMTSKGSTEFKPGSEIKKGSTVDFAKATDDVINRVPDPLDAEIRLHMSHDEQIG